MLIWDFCIICIYFMVWFCGSGNLCFKVITNQLIIINKYAYICSEAEQIQFIKMTCSQNEAIEFIDND